MIILHNRIIFSKGSHRWIKGGKNYYCFTVMIDCLKLVSLAPVTWLFMALTSPSNLIIRSITVNTCLSHKTFYSCDIVFGTFLSNEFPPVTCVERFEHWVVEMFNHVFLVCAGNRCCWQGWVAVLHFSAGGFPGIHQIKRNRSLHR